MQNAAIGIVGLGLIGTSLATRLMSAGFGVYGYDIDATRSANLVTLGGRAAASLLSLSKTSRRIVISVQDRGVRNRHGRGAAPCGGDAVARLGVSLTSQYLGDDVLASPLRFAEGYVDVPSGPGLGIDVDEARLRAFQVRR